MEPNDDDEADGLTNNWFAMQPASVACCALRNVTGPTSCFILRLRWVGQRSQAQLQKPHARGRRCSVNRLLL